MEIHAANPGFKTLWADPRTFAFTLVTMFLDEYCDERHPESGDQMAALSWAPPTIQIQIEGDWGVDLPTVNFDKLCSAISLLTTDNFFHSLPEFTRDCVVLSGHQYTPNMMILPDAADIAWGVTEGLLINPPDEDNENPFQPEITGFIGKVLDSEGILSPPDILRIATRDQELANRAQYDWGDDEELGPAIFSMEKGRTDDINRVVKGRMLALIRQLSMLPLRNGESKQMAEQMLMKLKDDGGDLPLPV